MKPIALTGNIGCGKSTVASLLAKLPRVVVFDCDTIAKEIIFSRKYNKEIAEIFGYGILTTHISEYAISDQIDIKMMAMRMFEDPEKKRRLESLIHPLVWEVIAEKIKNLPEHTISIVESAIIFEIGWENRFECVIAAICDENVARKRLRKKRWMSNSEIDSRLRSQLPPHEKARRAQFVIDTNCTLDELEVQILKLYETLTKKGNDV